MTPAYPIYIPTKGRADSQLTARALTRDSIPFHLVVEPQEADTYRAANPDAQLLVLPFSNQGSVIPARNWIKDHARAAGHRRHWQLDDNIRHFHRLYRSRIIPCDAGVALTMCEQFTDRYENVAVSGLNYEMFVNRQTTTPFIVNVRVYSCSLILNDTPHQWRGRYNEDTDYCLQVLADGWCTILLNAFVAQKQRTMTMKGGNNSELYQHDDGRLRMARSLERMWPGVVETRRRFQRPQHVVKDAWKRFDTPLRLRPDLQSAGTATAPDEHGLQLIQTAPIQSPTLQAIYDEHQDREQT